MPGAPLSLPEREEIIVALIEELVVPWAEFGRRVGRHSTTIAREVTGHATPRSGEIWGCISGDHLMPRVGFAFLRSCLKSYGW
jgi:hypothetical protein